MVVLPNSSPILVDACPLINSPLIHDYFLSVTMRITRLIGDT